MNLATVVARIPLGLVFVLAGLSGFIFFQSRWVLFVDAIEVVAGALLLAHRFVTFALTPRAGVIFNIISFHVTLALAGYPIAGVVALLWSIVRSRYRLCDHRRRVSNDGAAHQRPHMPVYVASESVCPSIMNRNRAAVVPGPRSKCGMSSA